MELCTHYVMWIMIAYRTHKDLEHLGIKDNFHRTWLSIKLMTLMKLINDIPLLGKYYKLAAKVCYTADSVKLWYIASTKFMPSINILLILIQYSTLISVH